LISYSKHLFRSFPGKGKEGNDSRGEKSLRKGRREKGERKLGEGKRKRKNVGNVPF
jgi:hypothetical protein